MLSVLVNAYAVSPNWGSEPGLGWNWVVNLAKYCNVFVITEGEWRNEIEQACAALPQKDNLHFYYNPLPPDIRQMCWNQGNWRFYRFYRQWQEKTLEIAKEIVKEHRIDIIHQLNMIGFREPGSLWKIKDIPFVWGPVGGYGWKTMKYLKGQPESVKVKALVKNLINSLQGRFYPLSNKAMKRADCVLAANSDVYKYIRDHHREDVILMNETGCYENEIPVIRRERGHFEFKILWVGKFDYRKQLELAIRTVASLKGAYPFISLDIVGDTNNPEYVRMTKLADNLECTDNIVWHGKIPNAEVHKLMQASDIFLFTSIDEGTPHVVLEAIQNCLPVVCFDTCGQGDVVTEDVGIKVPLSDADRSPTDFARAISTLLNDSSKLALLRKNCSTRQKELSWENKIGTMIGIYQNLLCSAKNNLTEAKQ